VHVRKTSQPLIFLLLLAAPGAAQQDVPRPEDPLAGAAVLDREALLAAVRERNPSLEAARQAWQAATARPAQERSLENPMVSYGVAPLSLASDDVSFGHEIEVRQGLPYPGKRRARAAMAQAEAEAAFQSWREAILELSTRASLLYDDYYLVHRALAINAEHRRLLNDAREVATARYAAGLAMQQDPIQAEVEGTRLLLTETELEAERRVTLARLNALLHRAPDAPLPPPPARLPDPEPMPAGTDLIAAAIAARPELAARAAEIRAREAGLDVARLARRPDFEAMGSYSSMWMEPEHRVMVGIGISLPFWRERTEAARAEAESRLAQAQSEQAALEAEVRAQVQEALEMVHEALHHLSIYRDRLLPASRDQLQAARAAFETGGGTFLGVIEAERSLRDAELGFEEALAETHRHRAMLDRALGRLPGGEPSPPAPLPTALPDPRERGEKPVTREADTGGAAPLLTSPLLQPSPAQGGGKEISPPLPAGAGAGDGRGGRGVRTPRADLASKEVLQ
jgi:outer membrane protein TolC